MPSIMPSCLKKPLNAGPSRKSITLLGPVSVRIVVGACIATLEVDESKASSTGFVRKILKSPASAGNGIKSSAEP